MGNIEDIANGFAQIQSKKEEFQDLRQEILEQANKLIPAVIEHFNHYVMAVINQALPDDEQLQGTNEAGVHFSFELWKYEIRTGGMVVPHGISDISTRYEDLYKLLKNYEENTPWAHIRFEFS